ncbi:MAG TPA: outer membrane beta-barrel protein [Verrucomicrobiae bacterium]|nr:outer membrane beta-barrel protein [Verrucomicrobiae bacterium]
MTCFRLLQFLRPRSCLVFCLLLVLFRGSDYARAQAADSSSNAAAGLEGKNFFARLAQAYKNDWTGKTPAQPSPTRIPPAPLDSPPFPNAYWNYGGASVIGATNTTDYPLMEAIYSGSSGEAWKRSGVQIYGWINPGFNFSTSSRSLLPLGYNFYPNRIELDQFVTYIERVPDTVQTEHFDWGFRVGNMYGIDYHFTTAKGWFSQQLLSQGRQYGDDPLMVYLDLYFPKIADGMNIRIGRYISVPDIEAQLAVNNYTYTHSLLFSYDPFTQTGVISTLKLNDRWLINLGISAGNDIAPWAEGAKSSLTACVSYTFRNGNDMIYPCASGINSGKYAYNNVQLFVTTWYHKFNPSWHMATEAYYEYERDVPSIFGPIPPQPNANGAYCAPGQIQCFAPEWAIVNYLQKEFSTHNYISIRNEVFDDSKGQRTGYKTTYSENAFAYGHWIGSTVVLRPELRFEHAYSMPAYNLGTKQSQFTFSMDVIFRY